MSIFKKDVEIKESFVFGGYLLLKHMKQAKKLRITYFDAANLLDKAGLHTDRQQFFCFMFLYSVGLIEFNQPFFELKNENK